MSRASRRFNFLIAVGLLALLCGCYEGFKHPNSGPGNSQKPGGQTSAPFSYLQLELIYPTRAALVSNRCGNVPESLADLRTFEIEARKKAITSALSAMTDDLRVVKTEIGVDDCASFGPIEARAISQEDLPLNDSMRAKPILQVRFVVWFEGGSPSYYYPSIAVQTTVWHQFANAREQGFTRQLSVNDFIIAGDGYDYIRNWQNAASNSYIGLPINDLPYGTNATDTIAKSVAGDTAAFANWLAQKATEL